MNIKRNTYTFRSAALAISTFVLAITPQNADAGHYAPSPAQVSTISSLNLLSASAAMAAASNGLAMAKERWRAAAAGLQAKTVRVAARTADDTPAHSRRMTPPGAGVFGSVAIPFKALPSSANWKAVYPSIVRADFATCTNGSGCTPRAEELAGLVREIKAKPFSQKLAAVNRAVNRNVAYVSDRANYRRLDVWAKPTDILKRGKGDCEDYAILKMAALNAAGIPLSSMSLVVLQDQSRSLFHAVLTVSTTRGHYVLDNLHDRVMKDTALASYLPLYSLSGNRSWIHGRKRDGSMVATLAPLPRDLAPGEGFETAARRGVSSKRIEAN